MELLKMELPLYFTHNYTFKQNGNRKKNNKRMIQGVI